MSQVEWQAEGGRMGQHVHVRVQQGLGVTEEGELVERSGCRCGARWTKTYPVLDAEPDQ